ncbi:hypothetical protein C8R45DRAFT_862027 [Mycena sanguinolenta]|nr:hypothetical protein C8R45DRAFT_862027 [Mycena sanguinolenta]
MIQELLLEKTAHLAKLNAQAPRRRSGKKLSRQLRAELDYTRAFIKFHRALISPWRRLPVEILSEIFLFTLKVRGGDRNRDDLYPWVDDRRGTLLLCQICSTWRAVALQTPALWNTLSFQSYWAFRRPLDWVSTWLDRSRSSPLHLQLRWDPNLSPNIRNSVLSAFTSHLPHTVKLAVEEVQYAETPRSAAEESHPQLPLIESSVLSSVNVCLAADSPIWDWIHSACRASPDLTHLSTSHFSADSFPLANLTDLDLGDPIPMLDAFQVFEYASNLQNVAFRIKGPAVACSAGALLGMKSVSKMEIFSDDPSEFLERTEFPNLVTLAMSHCIFPWPDAEFRSFLSRSSCALKGLGFYDCYITQDKIIDALQHGACKTLETFYVDECVPSEADALLQHLSYKPDRPLCNPKLRVIELHDIFVPDGVLSAMVESRLFASSSSGQPAPIPMPLDNVSFSFVPRLGQEAVHPEDWKRLRELDENEELEIGWPDLDLDSE